MIIFRSYFKEKISNLKWDYFLLDILRYIVENNYYYRNIQNNIQNMRKYYFNDINTYSSMI